MAKLIPAYMTHRSYELLDEPPDEVLVVDESFLNKLLFDAKFLSALRQCGVDNWEGYSDAWDLMEEDGD